MEIIVVNDMSSDDTAEIATASGAKIINAESKNGMIDVLDKIGFESVKGGWILRMDADERMIPTLAQALKEVTKSDRYTGVCFARKQIIFGEWVRNGGWFKNDQLRFFRADSWDSNWHCEIPHSQVPIKGPILVLPLQECYATIHYDYNTIDEFIQRTLKNYAMSEAYVALANGRRFSALRMIFKPIKRFMGRYFIRKGFRDGTRGLILAGLLAAYDFCIEANLWDLQRKSDK
jgi:glycosyltransferase involved in cell wall biosynthesis